MAQGVLATLQWSQDGRSELIVFTIASYLLSVAQFPAIVWNPSSRSWGFRLYLLLVAYMLAASLYLVVAILHTHKKYYFDKDSNLVPPMVALALASMFFAGVSVSRSHKPSKVQDPEESQMEKDLEEIHDFTDANSADWKAQDTHSEELSLNKSFQIPSPAMPQKLNNKDSDKTLIDRKGVDVGKSDEDVEAATVSWLVQASLSPNALDDHLGENWMAARLHHSINADMYHLPEPQTHLRYKSSSGDSGNSALSRSNTTGQLWVKKSRKARTLTSSSSLSSREAYYPTLGFRSGLISKLHERSRSIDADMALNVKPAVAWAHLATNSQSSTGQYTDVTTVRNSQSTLPKISLSDSLTQTKGYSTLDPSPSFNSSMPQTPEDVRFFSAPATSPNTHSHSAGSSMGDIIEGLEEIPGGISKWNLTGSSSMKNISLQEWERKKHSWLACEHEVKPIVYYLNSQNDHEGPGGFQTSKDINSMKYANQEQNEQSKGIDGILMRSFSAPSLHTYRPTSDNNSAHHSVILATDPGSLPDPLDYTLYRTQTPPALTLVMEVPSVHASPMKKILNFIKRDLFLEATGLNSSNNSVLNGHKHTDSVTTSMISAASGKSSRSGLPRKAIKNLFSRPSQADIPGTRTLFAFAMTPRMSPQKEQLQLVYSKPKKPLTFRYQDWEADTLEGLDRSRVSSVPSAVIGEYDREKWRTLKELLHPTQHPTQA